MPRPSEPEITLVERKSFKMTLIASELSIVDWARLNDYRPQFIRQVLINDRRSNYARLLIRNFIKDNIHKIHETIN